jgi:hypothetical protein
MPTHYVAAVFLPSNEGAEVYRYSDDYDSGISPPWNKTEESL